MWNENFAFRKTLKMYLFFGMKMLQAVNDDE